MRVSRDFFGGGGLVAGVKAGARWAEEREEIVAREWTPCISSLAEAADFQRIAARRGTRLSVHLALDAGMGRGDMAGTERAGESCGGQLIFWSQDKAASEVATARIEQLLRVRFYRFRVLFTHLEVFHRVFGFFETVGQLHAGFFLRTD